MRRTIKLSESEVIGVLKVYLTRSGHKVLECKLQPDGTAIIQVDEPKVISLYGDTIISNSEILGGVPTFKGTRISVKLIQSFIKSGISVKDILADYPTLTEKNIIEAIAYVE